MHHFVDVVGRDAHVDRGVRPVEDESADPASLPDTRLALPLPLLDDAEFILWGLDLRHGNAPFVVVRLRYRVGEVPLRSHPGWAERPRPFELGAPDVPTRAAVRHVVPGMRPSPVNSLVLLPYVLPRQFIERQKQTRATILRRSCRVRRRVAGVDHGVYTYRKARLRAERAEFHLQAEFLAFGTGLLGRLAACRILARVASPRGAWRLLCH